MPDDYYVSQYSGEEIDERLTAAHNAVRYDAAQSLTNDQKAQARGNISALNGQFLNIPNGGGQIGWYRITEPFYEYSTSGYLTVSHAWADGGPSELLLGVSSTPDTHGKLQCLRSAGKKNSVPYISNARLVRIANTYVLDLYASGAGINNWDLQLCNCGHNLITLTTPTFISADDTLPSGETLAAVMEYQNPPMLLGVEYRTTERYLGKPVYCKLVNFGALPNKASKDVIIASDISAAASVDVIGTAGALLTNYDGIISVSCSPGAIRIATSVDMSDTSVYCLCKYTKTTD